MVERERGKGVCLSQYIPLLVLMKTIEKFHEVKCEPMAVPIFVVGECATPREDNAKSLVLRANVKDHEVSLNPPRLFLTHLLLGQPKEYPPLKKIHHEEKRPFLV